MDASDVKRIFLPLHPLLYRIALRITGNREDAEDLVQETYLRLWKQRDRLDAVDNAQAYAVTTLRHVCFSALKSRPPDEMIRRFDPATDSNIRSDDDETAECREESELIVSIIDSLPSPRREIVMMRDLEDLPFDEIAEKTGLTRTNVRVTLFRARKQIKELFKRLTNDQ